MKTIIVVKRKAGLVLFCHITEHKTRYCSVWRKSRKLNTMKQQKHTELFHHYSRGLLSLSANSFVSTEQGKIVRINPMKLRLKITDAELTTLTNSHI